jgi:hypothetical protein
MESEWDLRFHSVESTSDHELLANVDFISRHHAAIITQGRGYGARVEYGSTYVDLG